MSNVKDHRFVQRGYTRPQYECFDCGDFTAHVMLVYRGGLNEFNKHFVHRAGSGCHKGETTSEVREPDYKGVNS